MLKDVWEKKHKPQNLETSKKCFVLNSNIAFVFSIRYWLTDSCVTRNFGKDIYWRPIYVTYISSYLHININKNNITYSIEINLFRIIQFMSMLIYYALVIMYTSIVRLDFSIIT